MSSGFTRAVVGATVVAAALTAVGRPRGARACGGCFAPTEQVSVVTDHRMAVSFNGTRTVLWDQFVYSGRAEDFVWVLPVGDPDTDVELAEPEFFDQLEQATAPRVQGPVTGGGGGSGGFGCGSSDSAGALSSAEGPGVMVHSMETVGPYETVTVSSTSPTALVDWLQEHGYAVPDSILPIVQHYVDMEFAFVVLRLSPGEGIQAMQPVRVAYPGTATVFPLRMISAGIADKVGLLLWVFGEGRFEPENFENGFIDNDRLRWSTSAGTSNYPTVFDETIRELGGRAWITEAALQAENLGWQYDYDPTTGMSTMSRGADWSVALTGISQPLVTRLRTELAAAHLDQDLVLRAAFDGPTTVSNLYFASQSEGSSSLPATPVLVVLALGSIGLYGRRRRGR